jgi:hypothetical protein
MLKKTITYTDYNGVERTEDFMFNLTKAEILEMQLTKDGGMDAALKKIVDAKDAPEIMKVFKELILKAYGVVSDDGRRFIKSKEISDSFSQTEAFSMLFMELATDTDAAAAFVNGIVPAADTKPAIAMNPAN